MNKRMSKKLQKELDKLDDRRDEIMNNSSMYLPQQEIHHAHKQMRSTPLVGHAMSAENHVEEFVD